MIDVRVHRVKMIYRGFTLLFVLIVLFQIIMTGHCLYVCNSKSSCSSKAGNDECDSQCDNLGCSYDSGDCLSTAQTWSKCGQASRCETSFYNDTCDSVCNNENCLYDNFKCKTAFTEDCFTTCLEKWGNGICDAACNKVQCGYDGNDCSVSGGSTVSGYLYVYAKSVIPKPTNSARFIGFTLSLATRTVISLKMASKYNGTVPEVESLEEAGIRMLYEVQNIPNCNNNLYSVCWGDLVSVAHYSSAAGIMLNQFLHNIGVNVTITKVIACKGSFHGEDCSTPCSPNCKSGCDIFDGTCIDGCQGSYFGEMCQYICSSNCKHGCSITNGTNCINGECNAGFTGIDCKTDCLQGTYGGNCAFNCSVGCEGDSCNAVDGACVCKNGYNGTKCEYECSDGTYGMDCSSVCGQCLFASACDKLNGSCVDGCDPGYYGDLCNDACSAGTYGSKCQYMCSSNCVNSSCDGATGNCLGGCLTGWFGSQCSTNVTNIVYDSQQTATTVTVTIVVVVCVLIGSFVVIVVIIMKRSRRSNYQTNKDKKIFIGEGKDEDENPSIDDLSGTDMQEQSID